MEKLIDLLSRGAKNDDWCLVRIEGNVRKFDERLIISKSYGFIKRLVDNDKIDESKIEIHWFSFYESVLMELAIQDEPIEFLISILK